MVPLTQDIKLKEAIGIPLFFTLSCSQILYVCVYVCVCVCVRAHVRVLLCFVYKLNPALSKSMGTIFPMAFAHFVCVTFW